MPSPKYESRKPLGRRTHNVNVRIPSADLIVFQELSAEAGVSLNRWVLRACLRKAEQELLLASEREKYEGDGFHAS